MLEAHTAPPVEIVIDAPLVGRPATLDRALLTPNDLLLIAAQERAAKSAAAADAAASVRKFAPPVATVVLGEAPDESLFQIALHGEAQRRAAWQLAADGAGVNVRDPRVRAPRPHEGVTAITHAVTDDGRLETTITVRPE